jgi:hypothetical protein
MKEKNITRILAEYLADTSFEDLPGEAVESTKAHIQHTLGTIVAGSRAPGIQQVLSCIIDGGAKEESTVLVFGNKLPAPSAALMNATMAHCFHVDMKDDRRSYPTGVAAIPAASAMVEKLGRVSGKELITAVCVGMELGVRTVLESKLQIRRLMKSPKNHKGSFRTLRSALPRQQARQSFSNSTGMGCITPRPGLPKIGDPRLHDGECALNETVGGDLPPRAGPNQRLGGSKLYSL